MGLAEELIAIKMRLQGAAAYQREMQRSTAATTEFGTAAERAGAQAKSGAVGMNAMNASANKGVGALTRMKRAGEGMRSTGSKMTSAWTVPLALIGGAGVVMALHFSDSMEQIATQAGASQREVNLMSKSVQRFAASGKSISGPSELADGLFRIESAGFRGKRAMDALIASEELATVGHANLEKTSTAVSAAMATQIKGTENLNETIGLMNSTVGIGNMRFEDLLSAMSTGLLDRAANFGLSLKEVGAALGTMTTVGQPAAASATRMAMAFNMMAAPTDKAKKAMKGIGLEATDMALSLRQRGLIPTLEMLKSHLDATFGTSPRGLAEQANAISEMFGGGRTSGGLVSLLRHVDLLKRKQGELVGVQQKFKTALARTKAQPITKLKEAWAQLQVVLIELGDALIPVVTSIAKFAVGAAKWFSSLPDPAKKVLIILGATLAVVGPLLSMVGTMTLGIYALAAAFGALDISMAGIPLLIGATAAVVVGLTGAFDGSSDSNNRAAETAKRVVKAMEAQKDAGVSLMTSERHLTRAKHRQRQASSNFKSAQADLNAVVNEYGRKSRPAIHAEMMLAKKRWSLVRATKAIKRAQREHGVALEMFKQLTQSAMIETKKEIGELKKKRGQFERLWTTEKNRGVGQKRLNEIAEWGTHVGSRLHDAHKKLNEIILEGAQKAGPAYARWLRKATTSELRFGEVLTSAIERLKKMNELQKEGAEITAPPGGQTRPHIVPRRPPGYEYPHYGGGGRHKEASAKAGASSVRPLVNRGGPTPTRLETRPQGGAGRARKGTPLHVHATFKVGRRKFGEAMAMAMIDDEANS